MEDLLLRLNRWVSQKMTADGYLDLGESGVSCTKFSKVDKPSKRRWHTRLAVVLQGEKEIKLGGQLYRCHAGLCTITPIDLPVVSRISRASTDKPFLAILIDLDPAYLSEIVNQIEADPAVLRKGPAQAFFRTEAKPDILETVLRLMKACESPSDVKVLRPLLIKEILYHVLKGEDGAAIRGFVKAGSKTHRVSQAIHKIQSDLEQEINIAELAEIANMSRAVFFRHFKEITSMSPIQYQKRLRLLGARKLMIEDGETAESSAFKVGYNSTSQFSREYSRMFGNSPLRETAKAKK